MSSRKIDLLRDPSHNAARRAQQDMENQVLIALATAYRQWNDYAFCNAAHFDETCGLNSNFALACCRSLVDQGFAKYASGLMNEDGGLFGSGYAITDAGIGLVETFALLNIREMEPTKPTKAHTATEPQPGRIRKWLSGLSLMGCLCYLGVMWL
jgi:hypothetical protein